MRVLLVCGSLEVAGLAARELRRRGGRGVVVQAVADGPGLAALAGPTRLALAVVDWDLAWADPAGIVSGLRAGNPGLPVLAFGRHTTARDGEARAAGAAALVCKAGQGYAGLAEVAARLAAHAG